MRTFKIYKLLIFTFSFFLIYSCQSDYTKLVKDELASGSRYDSIFHGLEFGQTRKEFYHQVHLITLPLTNSSLIMITRTIIHQLIKLKV